jgi:hypothetical protein
MIPCMSWNSGKICKRGSLEPRESTWVTDYIRADVSLRNDEG